MANHKKKLSLVGLVVTVPQAAGFMTPPVDRSTGARRLTVMDAEASSRRQRETSRRTFLATSSLTVSTAFARPSHAAGPFGGLRRFGRRGGDTDSSDSDSDDSVTSSDSESSAGVEEATTEAKAPTAETETAPVTVPFPPEATPTDAPVP